MSREKFSIFNLQFSIGWAGVLIKICGLTRPEDVQVAIAAGADMVGFVFVPGTPRAVTVESAPWVREITAVETVGVFRDASLDEICAVRDGLELDRIQLHGHESDALIDALGSRVIRRVDPEEGPVWDRVVELQGRCLPLLDPGAGSGVAVDFFALSPPPSGIRFGLAGGLAPDNVATAVSRLQPAMVDVSSGVETAPGVKDPALIRRFIEAARAAADTL